jgi:hypothetical protein
MQLSGQLHSSAAIPSGEESPRYTLNRRLGGPQSRSGHIEEKKFAVLEIKPWRSSPWPVAVPTQLSRLLCIHMYCPSMYITSVIVRFISVCNQCQNTLAKNFRSLTHCMNVTYVVAHEWASSLLFRFIAPTLWVLTIFWFGYVNCSFLYNGDGLQLIIYACDSWEIALNVCIEVSFGKMQGWKGIAIR